MTRRPATPDEELLAAEMPSVATELTDDDRVARMLGELDLGFERLRDLGPAVSLFGSGEEGDEPLGDGLGGLAAVRQGPRVESHPPGEGTGLATFTKLHDPPRGALYRRSCSDHRRGEEAG